MLYSLSQSARKPCGVADAALDKAGWSLKQQFKMCNMKSIPIVWFMTGALPAGLLSLCCFLMAASHAAAPPSAPMGPAPVSVLATDPIALVGSSTAAFTFVRSGPTTADLVVTFSYAGTAVYGTDFDDNPKSLVDGTNQVTIPAGFEAVDLVIVPKLDTANRGNKTVLVQLASAASHARNARAEVHLLDDSFNDVPPSISLVSPTNGTVVTLPTVLTLSAQVGTSSDSVVKVGFYSNDNLLGTETNGVNGLYSLSWTNPPLGNHELFARVVDALGKSSISSLVTITVTGTKPTITLTAPANKATFDVGVPVVISGTATGADPLTIKLYDGGHLLQTLSGSPFSYAWTNAPAGKHQVTAKVIDGASLAAYASASISIMDLPPTVAVMSPTNGQNFTHGVDITFTATASDPDDSIKRVAFYLNDHFAGLGALSADKSSYSFTWAKAKRGLYVLRAVAVNVNGTSAKSAPVVINVSP